MENRRTNQDRLGRRTARAMARLVPEFHDLALGLSAEDLVADLSPGLPVHRHEGR